MKPTLHSYRASQRTLQSCRALRDFFPAPHSLSESAQGLPLTRCHILHPACVIPPAFIPTTARHLCTTDSSVVKTEGGEARTVYTPQQLKQMTPRQYLDEMLAPALFEGLRRVSRDRSVPRPRACPVPRPRSPADLCAGAISFRPADACEYLAKYLLEISAQSQGRSAGSA